MKKVQALPMSMAATLVLLLCANAARAGVGRWTSQGPDLGQVVSIVADPTNPSRVYAASSLSIYRSGDGGSHWLISDRGLTEGEGALFVLSLAIDPANPTILYAGTDFGGVFKSIDAGRSWAQSADGLSEFGMIVEWIVVSPASATTIYAATLDGVFKSVNGGATWQESNVGLPESNGTFYTDSLALDPAHPATLYLGSSFNGAYKSTNAGASWFPISSGLPYPEVAHIAIDPTNPARLFATNDYYVIDVGTHGGTVVRSDNGGASWRRAGGGLPDVSYGSIVIDPDTPSTLWVSSFESGVYRSRNAGASWSPASAGLETLEVGPLTRIPGSPSRLLAGTGTQGVYESQDGADTWTPLRQGLHAFGGLTLSDASSSPGILYAAGYGGRDGIARSTDGGATWQEVGPGIHVDVIGKAVAVDPTNASVVYASQNASQAVFKSTDGGETWDSIASGLPDTVTAFAIDRFDVQRVFAATEFNVYRSADGGATWIPASTPLGHTAWILIDRASDTTLFAPSGGVLYKSLDGADTWSAIAGGLEGSYVLSLAQDPRHPKVLYAGTGGNGVFRTTDGGLNWSPIGNLTAEGISALAVDPARPATLYAGTRTFRLNGVAYGAAGFFQSTDGGATWHAFNPGLTSPAGMEVSQLAIDADGQGLHAATAQGVYELRFPAAP